MGNKIRISTKNETGAPSAKVTVLGIDYTKLWTGTTPITGKDIEIDIGTIGEDGQPVWVYSHEDQITDAKIMGGFSYIIGEATPPQEEWVAQLDGATQSWVLSGPITVPADTDFKASFYINGVNDSFEGLFSSSDPQSWLRLLPSNNSDNLQGQLGVGYYQAVPFSELNLRDGVTTFSYHPFFYSPSTPWAPSKLSKYCLRGKPPA